jgi:ADP-ribose pyrophosphatase YjhB (NUDIX family)
MEPEWLKWAKHLGAISQSGLTYAKAHYDIERYEAVRQIAAEILSKQGDIEAVEAVKLFSGESGYATPKVDVRGVVFRNDAILMVKEHEDGKWTLPGGWADVCESPSENVIREVREESGFETRVVRLVAVYDRSKHPHELLVPYHIYKLFFLCEIIGGDAKRGSETDDVGFFGVDELPELSINRVTTGQIRRMFEHLRNPELGTDFD